MRTKFYIRSFTLSWDIRGTLKILGVTWPRPCQIFEKKIIPFFCACPCENVREFFSL